MAADEGHEQQSVQNVLQPWRVPSTKISDYIHHASYSAGSCFASTTKAGAEDGGGEAGGSSSSSLTSSSSSSMRILGGLGFGELFGEVDPRRRSSSAS